ncbi:MAG: helix-hairpin-helix domain-containing protein [Armatimonadota bacterium]|nr:helix-hairpin-helix domain-containing protein [Armatimonadota bacterium]MDR5696847.1 helix-hairpin-helix domain-containing protein [Armatimonadota bacterium]
MPQFTRHEALLLVAACVAILGGIAVQAVGRQTPPVVIHAPAETPPAQIAVAPRPAGRLPVGPVSLNTASAAELERLPGIGPKLAQRIVEDRAHNGPYASVEDLRRVKGIGPRRIEQIRPHVTIP